MDTIIFISNPFGFGPPGKTVILINELKKKWKGKIIYIASRKCLEIFPKSLYNEVEVIEANERDDKELKRILKKYIPVVVVVVLNKIAIKTAHDLGMKTIFIDPLSWMWKEIPKEYLSADTYYYYNIFGEQKKLKNLHNAKPIFPIFGTLSKRETIGESFLLHIGGFSNPFTEDNCSYLQLLGDFLLHIHSNSKIIITGGKSGVDFLAGIVGDHQNMEFIVADHNTFLDKMARAKRFITTPGFTATFESFNMKIPTSFLLPTNLSQWWQLTLFHLLKVAPLKMQWEKYFTIQEDLRLMSEQEALKKFLIFPKIAMESSTTINQMRDDFNNLFFQETDFNIQQNLIKEGDTSGAFEIISDILKVVNHSGN